MKYTRAAYTRLEVDSRHRYADKFVYAPQLATLVTFQPNVKLPVHRWFYYKHGFAPQLVEFLLDDFAAKPTQTVFDPFCGVGTTLLAAKARGHYALGCDLSPLPTFVAKVKLSDYDANLLRADLTRPLRKAAHTVAEPPSRYYLKKAYDEDILSRLSGLYAAILETTDSRSRDFALLAFLAVCDRFAHVVKDGGFLRFRRREAIPDLITEFRQQFNLMLTDIDIQQPTLFSTPIVSSLPAQVMQADARRLPLSAESVDITITSPPYLNRCDYTRVYALELAWHFVDDQAVKRLRAQTLKSHTEAKAQAHGQVQSPTLAEAMSQLGQRPLSNPQIPEMVAGYFEDMRLCLRELWRVTRTGGRVALVVGTARFSGVPIEVDTILGEVAEECGFVIERIIVARLKGSSAQQANRYGELAHRESIVVVRKP